MPGVDPEQFAELRRLKEINRTLGNLHLKELLVKAGERRMLGILIEDEIVQHIVGARIKLETLKKQNPGFREDSAEIDALLISSLKAARRIIDNLAPHVLELAGLESALLDLATRYARSHQAVCHINASSADEIVTDATSRTVVYTIVARLLEGLVDLQHAGTVWVWLCQADNVLEITLEDNSSEFDIQDIIAPDQFTATPFLVGIDEEIRCLGGEMTVERTSDIRVVTILLPIKGGCLEL